MVANLLFDTICSSWSFKMHLSDPFSGTQVVMAMRMPSKMRKIRMHPVPKPSSETAGTAWRFCSWSRTGILLFLVFLDLNGHCLLLQIWSQMCNTLYCFSFDHGAIHWRFAWPWWTSTPTRCMATGAATNNASWSQQKTRATASTRQASGRVPLLMTFIVISKFSRICFKHHDALFFLLCVRPGSAWSGDDAAWWHVVHQDNERLFVNYGKVHFRSRDETALLWPQLRDGDLQWAHQWRTNGHHRLAWPRRLASCFWDHSVLNGPLGQKLTPAHARPQKDMLARKCFGILQEEKSFAISVPSMGWNSYWKDASQGSRNIIETFSKVLTCSKMRCKQKGFEHFATCILRFYQVWISWLIQKIEAAATSWRKIGFVITGFQTFSKFPYQPSLRNIVVELMGKLIMKLPKMFETQWEQIQSSIFCRDLGKKVAVATVTHTEGETQFVSSAIGQRIFGMAKKGALKLPGWPDFQKAVSDLQQPSSAFHGAEYQVCQPLADGTLVIKQALLDLYITKHPEFRDATEKALEAHNAEFNPENFIAGDDAPAESNGPAVRALEFDSKAEAEKIVNTEDARLTMMVLFARSFIYQWAWVLFNLFIFLIFTVFVHFFLIYVF